MDLLHSSISALFGAMGAEVRVRPDDDANLVRRGREGEAAFVVQAQGVPNLLHELGHVVWYGGLEDDHGIDYTAIPYDMHDDRGARVLAEELSCSALSCSYLARSRELEGVAAAARDAEVAAWFAEQVEIQPGFFGFGFEGAAPGPDLPAFRAALDAFIADRASLLIASDARLHAEVGRWLIGVGAPSELIPTNPLLVTDLWASYHESWRVDGA